MPTIIFDLDGTLVDTAPDLLAALNTVLSAAGHRNVALDELRHLVGYGVRRLFERAFEETGAAAAPETLAMFERDFLVHYRANIARESRPFPHVPETLSALARTGALMGVCTNKPQDLSELLLDELDLTRHFPVIHGVGRTPYNKPDPRHVLDVVAALNATPSRAVMVGDSSVDVAAARAAGIPVIAMSYGYTTEPVHELGADAVSGDFSEIPDLVAQLLR